MMNSATAQNTVQSGTQSTLQNTIQQDTMQSQIVRLYRLSNAERECPWGIKAAKLLQDYGIEFEDYRLTSREKVEAFKQAQGVKTMPQIFWGEQRIGGYSDLAAQFGIKPERANHSYQPVIALFLTAGLVAIAASLGISGFMGVSLAMLASLKFADLKSFTAGFKKYDLITQGFKPYGQIFPVLELLIGLGFLSGVAPMATGIGSLLVGTSGAVSVIKAVYIDKKQLTCACVGGKSKAPLGTVSFAENAIMVLMGLGLLLSL